jgi:hypothetical protein
LNFYRQNKTSNSTTNSPKKISALKHLERTDLWPPREDRYHPPTPETILIKRRSTKEEEKNPNLEKKESKGIWIPKGKKRIFLKIL